MSEPVAFKSRADAVRVVRAVKQMENDDRQLGSEFTAHPPIAVTGDSNTKGVIGRELLWDSKESKFAQAEVPIRLLSGWNTGVYVGTDEDGLATYMVNGAPDLSIFSIGTAVTNVMCDAVGHLIVTKSPVYIPATTNPPPYSGLYAQVEGTVTVAGSPAENRLVVLSGASLDHYRAKTDKAGQYKIAGMLINTTYAVSLAPRPGEGVLDPVEITITSTSTTQTVNFSVPPPPPPP